MSKDFVHIICILDRSGSMASLATEVIGSYNEFITTQQKEPGKAKVTLVLFDDKYEVVYDMVSLKKVPKLTEKEYFTRGMTGMFDAIGKAINSSTAKDAMVLIQTDGHENSSVEYNSESIKKLIAEKEAQGWDFIFLGANIDAADTGASFGIMGSKSVQYDASVNGVKMAFNSMNTVTTSYRSMKQAEFTGLDTDINVNISDSKTDI